MRDRQLIGYLAEHGKFKDDMFVNVTIMNVPSSLLRDFAQKVVNPLYPGGISKAIQDLMRKAVQKSVERDACE
jgi:hypothetical protein